MERRGYLLGQLLAELDAPLIVGVDAPHDALDEGDVLVERDEGAQRLGREVDAEDGRCGAVALEDASGNHPLGRALGADLVGGLAEGERLGLGEEVAQEELMDVLAVVAHRVGRVGEGDEVGGDHAGALMDQLVESVLAVGARLAPEDLARGGGDGAAVPADVLAVGLHGELLQIGREAMQVLVIGQHGMALGAEEVHVPDVEQAHERDDVLLERSLGERAVDGTEALEEGLEALTAESTE